MKVVPVIFMTLAVLSLLIPTCSGDGGDGGDGGGSGTSGTAHAVVYSYLLTNKFLYELTRSDGASPTDSVISRWIKSIGSKLGITLNHSSRLWTVLINRANYLRLKVKKFTGSASQRRYLQQNWELHLEDDDVRPEVQALTGRIEELEDELLELHHEVSHAEQDMKELVAQNHDIGDELRTTVCFLEIAQEENKHLREGLRLQNLSGSQHLKAQLPPETHKWMDDYSESHRRRRKREISKSCDHSLQWLQGQGYIPTSITAVNMTTGQTELIDLRNQALAELFQCEEEVDEDDLNMINMALYLKDWHNISHDAYHELAKLSKELPRQYKLKRRISELNSLWNICPTPNDTHGVQQSLKERLGKLNQSV